MLRPAAGPTLRHSLVIGGLLVSGLLLTAIVWRVAARSEEMRIEAEFRRRAEAQARIAQQRLLLFQEMTQSLRNFIHAQNSVTPREFRAASQDMLERYHSVQALEWVQFVTAEERDAFEQRTSRELGQPFRITERDSANRAVPAGRRPEYAVIKYVEPYAGNETVLGYDIFTAPTAPILRRARETRRFAVTHQFPLAQSTGPDGELGVIFIVPVFTLDDSGDSGAFKGYAQSVFQVEVMLGRPHRMGPDEALNLYYLDLDAAGGEPALLYANEAGRESLREGRRAEATTRAKESGAGYRQTFEMGGRRWQLLIRVNPTWLADQRTAVPGLLFGGGFLITLLIALLAHTLLRRTHRIEREVAERTEELLSARRLLEDDIRQREDTEQRLRESEGRLQAILDHSPGAIFVKDPAGRYLLFNRPYADLCRRPVEEIVGRTDFELFPEAQARASRANDDEVLRGGRPHTFEETASAPGGPRTSIVQKFPLRDAAGGIYALGGIVTDITDRVNAEAERREMERRLQASQKLESLGVLAGGIAHDFNNILTAVLGNASLARQIGGPESPVQRQLGQIESAARRAADLCQQMLAYAGKGRIATERVDLGEIVRGTFTLLEVAIDKNIRLDLRLAESLPPVLADATQLRQIVMNLIINAADAVGEATGEVTVSTFTREAAPADFAGAIGHPRLPAGTYVGLEVSDNGCGMAPEVMARIFEPFFTTKFSGRGLGLSAVLGIVQSHKGALFVQSRPGRGSTFRLLLPAISGATGPAPAPAAAPKPARLRGTVLVVDDEESVRDITAAALGSFGLDVLTAANGDEAVARCREHGERINLVLLDLTMPGISGEETIRRLRLSNARPGIILMSGYSESEAGKRVGEFGVAGFLQKPFELEALFAKLRPFLG